MSSRPRKRSAERPAQRVWVFSEPNREIDPRDVARILTRAGLEAARRRDGARQTEGSDD